MSLQHQVQPGKIREEINRIWSEKLSAGQIKASLFNLVIYARDARRAAYLQEIAHDILERFPCRIIFIKGDREGEYLDLSITNEIVGKSKKKMTCDELMIDVGRAKLDIVPFIVIPHLVPDLPIYLLWGQDPTEDNDILPYLEQHAKRLIFDSECTSDLQTFAKEMEMLMDATAVQLTDVNWAHISGWRMILSKVFDTKERLDRLKNAETIRITYNKSPSEYVRNHETKAIYLQGWLASALGWKLERSGKQKILYKGTTVELIPGEEKNLFPGAILGFEAAGKDFDCQITRKDSQPKVTVHMTIGDHCDMPLALLLPDLKKRSIFMREIFYTSVNEHYRKMLQTIGKTKWEM